MRVPTDLMIILETKLGGFQKIYEFRSDELSGRTILGGLSLSESPPLSPVALSPLGTDSLVRIRRC